MNPSDLHGRGPADYRLAKRGQTLWTNRFPFTLWDVGVADSGHIAGYAYSHGWRGYSDEKKGMGEFSVVILSPEGTIVAQDTYPREDSPFLDTPPNPLAQGVVMDEYSNRAVVRVDDPDVNRGIEQWWVYDLRRGKRIDTLEPARRRADRKHRPFILAARALPSTPLILVHWWRGDYPRVGGMFSLVDKAGEPVWTLTLDDDYNVPSDEAREDEVQELIRKEGAILSVGTNGTFDLHLVKDGLRASFVVEPHAQDTWRVRRIRQAPYPWPRAVPAPSSIPVLSLEKLGTTVLSTPGGDRKHPIRDVVAFDFDPEGTICALRADAPPRLLRLSQTGEVLKELPLPVGEMPKEAKLSNPANVGAKRFVVSLSDQAIDGRAQWFLADFEAGTVRRMTNAACPCVDAVAGFPDGRFVALTTCRMKYTVAVGLFFFDSNGNLGWDKEYCGFSGKPDELLSPEDVTRYGAHGIAVLDNVRSTIQIFDDKGVLVRAIDLEKAWGRKPNYPTHIAPDADGGFVLYDFNASQTLLRLDSNGVIRSASSPRLADGRLFRVADGVKRSPQGDLWTSDGDSLFRLSTNSTVDLVLGQKPSPSSLGAPGHVYVGWDDRVYVSDRRTKTVHVFDATGNHRGQCAPNAEDLTETSQIRDVAVSPDGSVYLGLDVLVSRYLRFDNDRRRTGWSMLEIDPIGQEWLFQPTNDLCWVVGYNDLFLVRGLRDTVRRISRRADGHWLEYPGCAALATDGSLAVVAHSQSHEQSVNVYGPTGEARSTFPIPREPYATSVAYDGQRVYVRREGDVLFFRANGDLLGRFALASKDGAQDWTGPFLAAKGRELWFVSAADLTIHRYAVPKESEAGVLPPAKGFDAWRSGRDTRRQGTRVGTEDD